MPGAFRVSRFQGIVMRDHRELKAAGLGASIVAAYMALVLASGRVDLADFAHLFVGYLFGSVSMWVLVMACAAGWLISPRSAGVADPRHSRLEFRGAGSGTIWFR